LFRLNEGKDRRSKPNPIEEEILYGGMRKNQVYLSHQVIFGSKIEKRVREFQISREQRPIIVWSEVESIKFYGLRPKKEIDHLVAKFQEYQVELNFWFDLTKVENIHPIRRNLKIFATLANLSGE